VRWQSEARSAPLSSLLPNVVFLSDPTALEEDFGVAIAEAERCFHLIAGPNQAFLPPPDPQADGAEME
jgi:hypothetical protein